MTTEGILSSHIYRRELPGIGPDDSLRRLADWIPADTTVLELGPATGYFTRYLSESLGCTVDAIELDTGMAEQVRPFCRKLIVGDLVDPDILAALDPLFGAYATQRQPAETFGDFLWRAGLLHGAPATVGA